MADEEDIITRLNNACVGLPYTIQIPWPHRLLHDAVEEIQKLREDVAELGGIDED